MCVCVCRDSEFYLFSYWLFSFIFLHSYWNLSSQQVFLLSYCEGMLCELGRVEGYLLEHGQHISGYTTEESEKVTPPPQPPSIVRSPLGRGRVSWALSHLSVHSSLFENVSEQPEKLEIYAVIASMFIVITWKSSLLMLVLLISSFGVSFMLFQKNSFCIKKKEHQQIKY